MCKHRKVCELSETNLPYYLHLPYFPRTFFFVLFFFFYEKQKKKMHIPQVPSPLGFASNEGQVQGVFLPLEDWL